MLYAWLFYPFYGIILDVVMIKFIEELTDEKLDTIIRFAESDCLGVRSLGPILAYGTKYDFLRIWLGENSNGKVTALITKFYGAVTAVASEDADIEELDEFLEVIGYSGLCLNYRSGDKYVMKLEKGKDCIAKTLNTCNLIVNSNYRDFYGIISECHKDYSLDSFDEWFVDISHRVRHKTADTFMLSVDDKFVSTVAALSVTEKSVFITAVSTLPNYRGKHYAHSLIKAVCEKYSDKSIYLFCVEDKVPFYEKAGFMNTDKIFVK